MKKLIVMPVAFMLLVGCSGAPHLDKEFGKASHHSMEMQIANPDYRYADQTPVGLTGLIAEEIMEVHTDDFGQAPKTVDVFQLGISK